MHPDVKAPQHDMLQILLYLGTEYPCDLSYTIVLVLPHLYAVDLSSARIPIVTLT